MQFNIKIPVLANRETTPIYITRTIYLVASSHSSLRSNWFFFVRCLELGISGFMSVFSLNEKVKCIFYEKKVHIVNITCCSSYETYMFI